MVRSLSTPENISWHAERFWKIIPHNPDQFQSKHPFVAEEGIVYFIDVAVYENKGSMILCGSSAVSPSIILTDL